MREEEKAPKSIDVPIDWDVPDDLLTRYATNIVVQHTEHEFIFSFFEIRPPILVGTPEQIEEVGRKIKSVRAKCIARIVFPAAKGKEFLEVIQKNYEKHLAKFERADQ